MSKNIYRKNWYWHYNLTFIFKGKISTKFPHVLLSLEWNMLIFWERKKESNLYDPECAFHQEGTLPNVLFRAKGSCGYMSNHNLCGAWDPRGDHAACYGYPFCCWVLHGQKERITTTLNLVCKWMIELERRAVRWDIAGAGNVTLNCQYLTSTI